MLIEVKKKIAAPHFLSIVNLRLCLPASGVPYLAIGHCWLTKKLLDLELMARGKF
jgi:hypothetical protein